MKKKVKLLSLIIMTFVLSSCSANYEIKINQSNNITEKFTISVPVNEYEEKCIDNMSRNGFSEYFNCYYKDYECRKKIYDNSKNAESVFCLRKILKNKFNDLPLEFTNLITIVEDGNNYVIKGTYTSNNVNNMIINNYKNIFSYTNENNFLNLNFMPSKLNTIDSLKEINNINLSVFSNYNVTSENSNSNNNNIYSWSLSNNSDDANITYNLKEEAKKGYPNIIMISITIVMLIIIVVFILMYSKYQNKKNKV